MDLFKEKVLQVIEICNLELIDRKNGIEGESTIEQLEGVIIPELKQVVDKINNQQLPQRDERYFNSFANAFTVWGWNMQSPTELFILLTELNNEYKRI